MYFRYFIGRRRENDKSTRLVGLSKKNGNYNYKRLYNIKLKSSSRDRICF